MTEDSIHYDTDGAELLTSREGLIAEIERLKSQLVSVEIANGIMADKLRSSRSRVEALNAQLEKERAEHAATREKLEWVIDIDKAKQPYVELHERLYVAVKKWIDSLELDKYLEPGETYWPNRESVYQSSGLFNLEELGVAVFDALKGMNELLAAPPASSTDERERLAEELIEWAAEHYLRAWNINICVYCAQTIYNPGDLNHSDDCLHVRALALRGKAEK